MNTFSAILLILSLSPKIGMNNFDFYDEVNNIIEGNVNVNYIEFQTKMEDELTKEEYVYYDFFGNNGYVLMDQEKKLLLVEEHGDIREIRENKLVNYAYGDFFVEGKKIQRKKNKWDSNYIIGEVGSISQEYNNYIEYSQLESYIEDKYSLADFTLYREDKLEHLSTSMDSNGYEQYRESVYVRNSASEGNCGIVSMANAIAYFSRTGNYSLLPQYSATKYVYPTNESIYQSAISAGYSPKSESVQLHTIYSKARDKAIEKGYVIGGMNDEKTEYCYVKTLQYYGYLGTFTVYDTYSINDITTEIANDRPIQLRTQGDVKYGGHGFLITGYKLYSAETIINNMTAYLNLVMVSVYDGHSSNERWYDLTYLSNLSSTYDRASSQTIAKLTIR